MTGVQTCALPIYGTQKEVSADQIKQGRTLILRVGAEAQADEDLPQSASEWFAFTVRHYKSPFVDAIFATTLASIIGLVSALYTMQVYDRVVPTKGYDTLIVLTIGVAIAIALELILKEVRAHIVERACKVIDQELSAVFFAKALNIRMDARPRTVGTFASQIRHFESVRSFMTSSTLSTSPLYMLMTIGRTLLSNVSWFPFSLLMLKFSTS